VIVLGDLIQGEKATAGQYEDEFQAINLTLNELGDGNPDNGVEIPWIPVIGNHDVWCNLSTAPVHLQDCRNIPQYIDNTYPEEIFNQTFGPVYNQLATTFAAWTKQDEMPIRNPYSPTYPDTYFQNFVFDYGDYHFVCLDWCARDDFDPGDWTMETSLPPPSDVITYDNIQFGYARNQTAYDDKGTINWFEDHLEKYGYCNPDRYDRGYKRTKNIILISHHAPIFYLNGTGTYDPGVWPIPITWELENESTYGFNESEYNDLVSLLNTLNLHYFNYHWFTGHYEVKNMSWTDIHITPDGVPVNVTASVQPLSWVPDDQNLTVDPNITINNEYFVKTKNNTNGSITIVRVLSPGGNKPDPSIYSQGDPDAPKPVVWDNPDIEFYNLSGTFVPSGQLDYNNKYDIRAIIYNKGCNTTEIDVNFTWGTAPNYPDNLTGFTGGFNPPNYNKKGPITIPSGEERVVNITWNTGVVAAGEGPTTIHACVRAIIEPKTITDDFNPNNNRGQENCDVRGCEKAASDEVIEFSFPIWNPTNITNGIIVDVYPEVGTLWNPEIILPAIIPPYGEGNVTLRLYPIPGVDRNVGDSEIFSLIVRRLDTDEIDGGLDVKVVVDDPPILNWTGDIGYQSDGVEPDEGNAGTTFTFRVNYKDENNHPPAPGYPQLYLFKGDKQIQGSPFVMNEEDPGDTVYANGKIYKYSIILTEPGDDYTYYFWARDSLGVEATGPATNVMSGPMVIGAIPPEFIVARINNSIYYFPYDETTNTFGSPVLIDTLGPCTGSPKIDGRVVDFDNDEDYDVLIDTSTWYVDRIELIVYKNTGTTFVPAWQVTQPGLGAAWGDNSFVVAGDFDEDGDWDFIQSVIDEIAPYTYDIDFYAWGNDWIPGGTLTFNPLLGFSIDTSPIAHPYDIECADFNNDGHLDLLIGDYPHGGIHVGKAYLYTGNGRWGFVTPANPCIEVNTLHPQPIPAMVSGDFYQGLLPAAVDVIVGLDDDGDPGQTFLFSNDGTGVFSQVSMFPPNPWTLHEPFDLNKADEYSSSDRPGGDRMDAKDFNKDGMLDIVASGGKVLGISPSNGLWYSKGLGSGTFDHLLLIHSNAYLIAAPERPFKYVINETKYQNSITQPIDVSKIHYKFIAVDEEWAAKWTTVLLYGQKETKYSIEIYLNETGYVTRVDFGRWGFPITEIPYDLAKQSLASLPPGFALDP
jgi:hypothetical protein